MVNEIQIVDLFVRDHQLDILFERAVDKGTFSQISLPLAVLLVENVILIALGPLDATGLGHRKPLGGTAMCFLFRHNCILLW